LGCFTPGNTKEFNYEEDSSRNQDALLMTELITLQLHFVSKRTNVISVLQGINYTAVMVLNENSVFKCTMYTTNDE